MAQIFYLYVTLKTKQSKIKCKQIGQQQNWLHLDYDVTAKKIPDVSNKSLLRLAV